MSEPKLFVSYRWSTPEHSEWVLGLASSLRHDGIDVVLDRWHLRPGHDALAFMENMVRDEAITKVLIICDRGYVERANDRSGGVGVETQIISPEVYASVSQDKFAAILLEQDQDGRPLLPTFMASRIYFDFTSDEAQARNYEEVVRWAFNKPIDVAPPIVHPPAFLDQEQNTPILIERNFQSRSTNSGKRSGDAASLLESVAQQAQDLILDNQGQPDQPELVYQAMLKTVSIREEVYVALRELIRSDQSNKFEIAHNFFEEVSKQWDYSPDNRVFSRLDNDVLKFFVHDCFVGFVAICISEALFAELADFLSSPFYRQLRGDRTGKSIAYNELRTNLESLAIRNEQKKLGRISLHADILAETHQNSIVPFDRFCEADSILYLRKLLPPNYRWYPESGLFLSRTYGALRVSVRAKSAKFYSRFSPLLFGTSTESLRSALAPYTSGKERTVRFDYETLDLARLTNIEELATSA